MITTLRITNTENEQLPYQQFIVSNRYKHQKAANYRYLPRSEVDC